MAIDKEITGIASYVILAISVCFGMFNAISYIYFNNIS